MIEALVRRFEERGFTVYVLPSTLLIRKVCSEDTVIGWDWCIPQSDLQERRLEGYLFDYADHIILKLNEAIAAHETPC